MIEPGWYPTKGGYTSHVASAFADTGMGMVFGIGSVRYNACGECLSQEPLTSGDAFDLLLEERRDEQGPLSLDEIQRIAAFRIRRDNPERGDEILADLRKWALFGNAMDSLQEGESELMRVWVGEFLSPESPKEENH